MQSALCCFKNEEKEKNQKTDGVSAVCCEDVSTLAGSLPQGSTGRRPREPGGRLGIHSILCPSYYKALQAGCYPMCYMSSLVASSPPTEAKSESKLSSGSSLVLGWLRIPHCKPLPSLNGGRRAGDRLAVILASPDWEVIHQGPAESCQRLILGRREVSCLNLQCHGPGAHTER